MTLTRKQAIRNLNELVSYRPQEDQSKHQFCQEDWRDYVYQDCVSLQLQTASKNEVLFLLEVWEIIKSYAVGFYTFKTKLFNKLTDPTRLNPNNLIPILDNQYNYLITEFKKGTRIILPDDFGGLIVAELLGTYKVSALKKKTEIESTASHKVKIIGTMELTAYIPIAKEGEYKNKAVYKYTFEKEEEEYNHLIYASDILEVSGILPKGDKGKVEYIFVGRKDHFRGYNTKVWIGEMR